MITRISPVIRRGLGGVELRLSSAFDDRSLLSSAILREMGLLLFLDLTDAKDPVTPGSLHIEFEVKNGLPLFWRIMFSPQDENVEKHSSDGDTLTERFFYTSRELALTRLHKARGAFDAADQSTMELYLEWIDLIASTPAHACLLRGDLLDERYGIEALSADEMGANEDQILNELVWSEWNTGMLSGHLVDQSAARWPPTKWATSAGLEHRGTAYRKWSPA